MKTARSFFSKPFVLIVIFISFVLHVSSQQKYMLCVGINNYTGTSSYTATSWDGRFIHNLTACVNDVDTVSKIFIKYYGFDPANIKKLLDRNAYRDSIINNLRRMASVCKAGDYMVFYYSGHGSLKYDEATQRTFLKGYQNSIVPADALLPKTEDITNNTLNDLFLAFTKKGVHLTVIMDACNSGTNTRGSTLFELEGTKEVEPSKVVFIKTSAETKATTPLAEQGAVTMAACQDNQEAQEMKIGDKKFSAFSYCLCNAITQWSKAPVKELYKRAVAGVKFLQGIQVPVMESSPSRINENLPGTKRGEQRPASFPLIAANGTYQLQGGFLDGLFPGDILVSNDDIKDSVQITTVNGPERSTVKSINKRGQLTRNNSNTSYRLLRLVLQPEPPLKVFISSNVSALNLNNLIKQARILWMNKTIHFITPSSGVLPQATIYYDAVNMTWKMNKNGIPNAVVLDDLTSVALVSSLKDLKIYLQLPYSNDLADSLKRIIQNKKNRNIGIVSSANDANYLLTGTFDNNNIPQYGWISMKWKQPDSADISQHTDFFSDDNIIKLSANLYDRLEKLSKLASWLTLQSPSSDGTVKFPFTLKIRNTKNKLISGKVFTGDTLKINFEKDNFSFVKWDSTRLFIYVFAMDPKGNMQLLFPGERTSIFDYPRSNNDPWLATIRNTTPGTYHYFLLSCKERIINTYVFNQQGVITRDAEVFNNPLEALIDDGGVNGRGNIRTPSNWQLQRIDVLTVDKNVIKK